MHPQDRARSAAAARLVGGRSALPRFGRLATRGEGMKSIYTSPFTSWTHRLSRMMVRPLVGGPVTPNHLTTARLVTGLLACGAFATGAATWTLWGGMLWIVSCLLDRADGELARLGGTSSPGGHLYDYYTDVAINGLLFVAIGIGLRDETLIGGWALVLGAVAGVTVAAASVLAERLEREGVGEGKAYAGVLGFDFDDVLYLLAPIAWLGWFPYVLIGAALGGPAFAILTAWRLRAALRRAPKSAPEGRSPETSLPNRDRLERETADAARRSAGALHARHD
jgi:archaetidylinositol phosphate synthase